MNKEDIAATLRQEVGELDYAIVRLQARCEVLKKLVLRLEAEIEGPAPSRPRPAENAKFRKVIDAVFGEKPKQPRR